MKVYNASGTVLATGDSPIDRMYTGQVWDAAAQMYYYNARFYDPKAARFLTMDPVREYMGPYAYVRWSPAMFTDPTGAFTEAGLNLQIQMALAACGADCESPLSAAALAAGYYSSASGGFAQNGNIGMSGSIQNSIISTVNAALQSATQSQGNSTPATDAAPGTSTTPQTHTAPQAPSNGPGASSSQITRPTLQPGASLDTPPWLENAISGLAGIATGTAIGATGTVLANAGVKDLAHAGAEIGRQLGSGGPFAGAATGLVLLADGTLLVTGGVLLTLTGGLVVGAAVNDYFVVPNFGGLTTRETFDAGSSILGDALR